MLYIGLSGGIASGKSLALAHFKTLGAGTISADAVAREVVSAGSIVLEEIAATFGAQVILANGNLDRAALREIVSVDVKKRKDLEAIMHPAIAIRSRILVKELSTNHLVVIHEVPLLIETARHTDFDRTLIIEAPKSLQLSRALARGNISADQALRFIDIQASIKQRQEVASDIIRNSQSRKQLEKAVEQLDQLYKWLAATRKTFTKFQ